MALVRVRRILLFLPLLTTLPCVPVAAAEPFPRVWINPGIYSWHFERNRGLRETNPGLGAEYVRSREHVFMGGTFINSEKERTKYAGYQWRPLQWKIADATITGGIFLGALNGYPRFRNGGWFVVPLPIVAIEYGRIGANFTFVPEIKGQLYGAIAAQIRFRVW